MAENPRKRETLTSARYELLAKLGSNADVLQHIANRFSQKGIALVTPKEFQQMIANCVELESSRLSRALDGERVIPSASSYSDFSQIRANINWSLPPLDSLDAMIFLDEEQNPLVLYKANGVPLADWLSQQNEQDQFEKTSGVLNDDLLASLARRGVIFEDGKLCKDGEVLSLDKLASYSQDLSNDALKRFASRTNVAVVSIDPSSTNQLAQEAEAINNPYAGGN